MRFIAVATAALSLLACSPDGTTSSGGMAEQLSVAGGLVSGLASAYLYRDKREDDGPPREPLMPEDIEAIELAKPYLGPCTDIFRTPSWELAGHDLSGGYAWPGGGCSLGPGLRDATVALRARKLLHEAGHHLYGDARGPANCYEQLASRALGLRDGIGSCAPYPHIVEAFE